MSRIIMKKRGLAWQNDIIPKSWSFVILSGLCLYFLIFRWTVPRSRKRDYVNLPLFFGRILQNCPHNQDHRKLHLRVKAFSEGTAAQLCSMQHTSICNPSEQFKGFMCSPRLCEIMKKHAGWPDIMTKLRGILSFCQAGKLYPVKWTPQKV